MRAFTAITIPLAIAAILVGGVLHFSKFNGPGGPSSFAFSANKSGLVVGSFNDPQSHGFIADGAQYTLIDFPGASNTYAHGINDSGLVVGYYNDSAGQHGFTYDGAQYPA